MTFIDIRHIDDPDLGRIAYIVERESGAVLVAAADDEVTA